MQREELRLLAELGGRVMPRGLWEAVGGMTAEKDLLERRVVMPLAQSELADRFGAVVFIDEVEEIASHRQGEPPSPTQGVTNELLKIIPAFRDQPGHLLICATNFIRALDAAFLRHGRFDYVIPIGLPDDQARTAIWERYIPAAAVDIDVSTLVSMTEGFSPADIEYAARKASQSALENAMSAQSDDPRGPFMTDYVAAISGTRATVSAEVAAEFGEDIDTVGRL